MFGRLAGSECMQAARVLVCGQTRVQASIHTCFRLTRKLEPVTWLLTQTMGERTERGRVQGEAGGEYQITAEYETGEIVASRWTAGTTSLLARTVRNHAVSVVVGNQPPSAAGAPGLADSDDSENSEDAIGRS